jgi:hypothetical protein
VFEVAPGARIAIRNLTVTEGSARDGAGILNRGDLVVSGVTFEGNRARRDGGAVMNAAGSLYLVNSTLAGNHAGREGGALASRAPARVVHVTFSENRVEDDSEGAQALHSTAPLHLANSILWSGGGRLDCHADPAATPMRGHNLIGRHHDCGAPLLVDDPEFEDLNYFNGPARTIPLNGRSPAVNMADNSLSLDDDGKPLRWDQRGNGDPRFVAGYADLGAFEVQAFPDLRVNTTGEPGLRSCLRSRSEGCPLRSAVELALALRRESVITFDERALPNPAVITLDRPLPEIDWPLTLEAPEGVDVYVRVPRGTPLPIPNLSLQGVRIGTE